MTVQDEHLGIKKTAKRNDFANIIVWKWKMIKLNRSRASLLGGSLAQQGFRDQR